MADNRLPSLPTVGAKRAVTLPRNGRSKDTGQDRLEELGYHQELSRQASRQTHTSCSGSRSAHSYGIYFHQRDHMPPPFTLAYRMPRRV